MIFIHFSVFRSFHFAVIISRRFFDQFSFLFLKFLDSHQTFLIQSICIIFKIILPSEVFGNKNFALKIFFSNNTKRKRAILFLNPTSLLLHMKTLVKSREPNLLSFDPFISGFTM